MSSESIQSVLSNILTEAQTLPVLNIQQRTGLTGYIDFISINEIVSPVMTGLDVFHRPFITVCANMLYDNNESVPTFTTFFQRYNDGSRIWMACGSYRTLMSSSGGMTLKQLQFLYSLLKHGEVVFHDGQDDTCMHNDLGLCTYKTNTRTGTIDSTMNYKRPQRIFLTLENPSLYRSPHTYCTVKAPQFEDDV